MSSTEILEIESIETSFIFEPLIRVATMSMLHGPEGIGKSRVCLSIARQVSEIMPVLYCDSETPLSLLQARIKEITPHPWLSFWCGPITIEQLTQEVESYGEPVLIIIDNFSSNFVGVEQSDQAAVAKIIRPLSEITKRGHAILLVHHNNRVGTMHGSVEFLRVPNLVLSLKQNVMVVAKSNYENPRKGQIFSWEIVSGRLTLSVSNVTENISLDDRVREQNRERQRRYREKKKQQELL